MSAPNRVDIASSDVAEDAAAVLSTPGEDGASRNGPEAAIDALSTRNQPSLLPDQPGRRNDPPIDIEIGRLARGRHRIVRWPELRAAGLSSRAAQHRVATGRLHRIYHGVYGLDPPETATRLSLLAAALAACGPQAVLSHVAAAELWGLLPAETGDIDVTVVGSNPGMRPGIAIHRVSVLDPRDIRTRKSLRVSSPGRVALELARYLGHDGLENLIARMRVELKVTERAIVATLDRYPRYPGAAILRAALSTLGGSSLTRSVAERRLLHLLRQAQLPAPATNYRFGRYSLDFAWPKQHVAVETDGFEFHGDRAAFERDRRRDATMVAAGWRVLRFTWRQLDEEPFLVVARIAQVLGSAAK